MKLTLVVLSVATIFANPAIARSFGPFGASAASVSAASVSAESVSSASASSVSASSASVLSASASASSASASASSVSASASDEDASLESATSVATPQPSVQPVEFEPVNEPEQVEQTPKIDYSKIDPEELEKIYHEIEQDALLQDLMQSGWPEPQAKLVLTLSDIVDSLTEVPEEEEQNEPVVSSLGAVRESMRELLAEAGLEFDDMDEETGGAISRVMITKKSYSRKNAVTVVIGLVNLMRTASKITSMLNNPNAAQYGMMISSAIQVIDSVVRASKGLMSPAMSMSTH